MLCNDSVFRCYLRVTVAVYLVDYKLRCKVSRHKWGLLSEPPLSTSEEGIQRLREIAVLCWFSFPSGNFYSIIICFPSYSRDIFWFHDQKKKKILGEGKGNLQKEIPTPSDPLTTFPLITLGKPK